MKYVFLHIEKTAGTSLVSYFEDEFGEDFLYAHPTELIELKKSGVLDRKTMVAGHFNFREVLRFFPNRTIITFLRDPVERVISFYNFVRERPITKDAVTKISKELTLEEFLDHCSKINDRRFVNGMTLKLSTEINPRNELASSLLNIENLDFIGFQATFEDSLIEMSTKYGFHKPDIIPRENTTTQNSVLPSPEAMVKLESINRDDQKVYDKALELRSRV